MRSCPIDCASIYYNGVRRSGLYTVVPLLAAMPLEVYCDMDTDGKPVCTFHTLLWVYETEQWMANSPVLCFCMPQVVAGL